MCEARENECVIQKARCMCAYTYIKSFLSRFNVITVCSCGGNLLMNVGPTADGRIVPVFEERLRQMGMFM